MAIPWTPTPTLELLQQAATLGGPGGERLCAVISADLPGSLRRRAAQLLVEADAVPDDLNELLAAAGFTDLDELRARAGRDINDRIAASDRYFTSRESEGGPRASLRSVLSREQRNLAKTLETLEARGVLETAAVAVLAGRRRWVLGDLKSVGYAALLATDLGASIRDVTPVEPTASATLSALCDAHPSDVVVAYSFQRYSRATVDAVQQFHLLGATVVAITDDDASPITEYADHVLAVHTSSDSTTHSPTTVVAVGHVLASLAAAGAKGATRRSNRRAAMAAALRCYSDSTEGTVPA